MEILDLKKLITFYPDKIGREMIAESLKCGLRYVPGVWTGTETSQGTNEVANVLR